MLSFYKLQLVQVYLYKLQLVQAVCTRSNLYKKYVQVATCRKSQLVQNIYIYIDIYLFDFLFYFSENRHVRFSNHLCLFQTGLSLTLSAIVELPLYL